MTQSRSPYGVLTATVVLFLLLLFLYSVTEVILLFFIAVLFSLYLGAVTDFLQQRMRVPRWAGLVVGLVLSLGGTTLLGMLIVPPVLEQTHALVSTLPALLQQWEVSLLHLAMRYPVLASMLPPTVGTGGYFDVALERAGSYFAGLFPYLFSGISFLIHIVSVLVMGIYLALRPAMYRDGFLALVPLVHRALAREVMRDLARTLRSWIVGQILAMVFLGVVTWVGLVALNVPYALAFGVFTGVAVMVPFFGTLISTLLPALFVLGAGGVVQALLVVLLGVVIHLIEANLVHPMIMERQVNLPPVLSLLAVLVMAEVLGAIGLVVAVPTLAIVMVLVRRIYVQRIVEGRGFRRTLRREAVGVPAVEMADAEV